MDFKRILGKLFLTVFKLLGKVLLLSLWACLRAIEFIARVLGDWVRGFISTNPNRYDRRNP